MATMDPNGSGGVNCTKFARWWEDNSSELEKQQELAFTVTLRLPGDQQGKFQQILLAPNRSTKEMWVKGLMILCKRKQKVDAEKEEIALIKANKRFTRPQVRDMVRQHLQREQRDPNVSDAWIDGLFEQFAVDNLRTIDGAAWRSLIAQLNDTKLLNRDQVRKMVRLQLQIDGRAALTHATSQIRTEDGNATDEWIDTLFDQFDADESGMIDEREWDLLLKLLEKQSMWLM